MGVGEEGATGDLLVKGDSGILRDRLPPVSDVEEAGTSKCTADSIW